MPYTKHTVEGPHIAATARIRRKWADRDTTWTDVRIRATEYHLKIGNIIFDLLAGTISTSRCASSGTSNVSARSASGRAWFGGPFAPYTANRAASLILFMVISNIHISF